MIARLELTRFLLDTSRWLREYIAALVTNLINKCIKTSYFPKAWKTAPVSPIPKVDNPTSNDQYQ